MQAAFRRFHEGLVATRPAASNRIKIHGATRVHAKQLATEEEKLLTTAKGNLASSSLKSRRRVVSSRAASSCAFPLVRFLTAEPAPRGCARTRRAGWLRNSPSIYIGSESTKGDAESSRCNLGLRSHAAEVNFSVITAAQRARATPRDKKITSAATPQAQVQSGAADRSGAVRAPGDC